MAEGAGAIRSMSDAELSTAIVALGEALELPADPGARFAPAVRERIEGAAADVTRLPTLRRRRVAGTVDRLRWMPPARRAIVLAAALVVLGAVAAGATTSTSPPAPLGSFLLAGRPVSLQEAQTNVAFHILVPTAPGLPAPQVYLDANVPGGAVTLVYRSGPRFPEIGPGGIGVAITEFEGRYERPLVEKFVRPGTTVEDVTVEGSPGFWVAGAPHEMAYIGPDGEYRSSTLRLSGNALLWEQGAVTQEGLMGRLGVATEMPVWGGIGVFLMLGR